MHTTYRAIHERPKLLGLTETRHEEQPSLRPARASRPCTCCTVPVSALRCCSPTKPARPTSRPRQYAILASVSQNPDISQTGLVEQTGVDRSTLADIVRRLVKKGLLQRKRTRRDARMYAVRLTAKGQSALGAVKPAAARVDQRMLSV